MGKRPAQSNPRSGGCCLGLFFLPFLAMGLFFAAGGGARLLGSPFGDKFNGEPWVGVLVGGIFALVGAGGIFFAIRQFLVGGRTKPSGAAAHTPWNQSSNWPSLKSTTSRLSGRRILAPDATPQAKLAGIVFFALIWNAVSWGVGYAFFREWHGGHGSIFPLLFIGLFCLIGLATIAIAIHQFVRVVTVGETIVELDSDILRAGESTRVTVVQKGDFAITRAALKLVCQEVCRYRRGTDTVTHTETVHDEVLFERQNLRAAALNPVIDTGFSVPLDAMHSFKASNNEVRWMLAVTLEIPGRPDVDDKYPFRVSPEAPR
jgi:hypothetical protein